MKKKWGHLQRDCHKMLLEAFSTKAEAYQWLRERFRVYHFADLRKGKDDKLLREIHDALYVQTFKADMSTVTNYHVHQREQRNRRVSS